MSLFFGGVVQKKKDSADQAQPASTSASDIQRISTRDPPPLPFYPPLLYIRKALLKRMSEAPMPTRLGQHDVHNLRIGGGMPALPPDAYSGYDDCRSTNAEELAERSRLRRCEELRHGECTLGRMYA